MSLWEQNNWIYIPSTKTFLEWEYSLQLYLGLSWKQWTLERKEGRHKEDNISKQSIYLRLNFPWPRGEVWLPYYTKFVNCCVNSGIPSESTTKCWNGLRTIKNNYNFHLSCILVITSTYRKLDGLVQITREQNIAGDCSSPGRRMVNLSQVAAPALPGHFWSCAGVAKLDGLLSGFLGKQEMNEMFSCLGISRQPLNKLWVARNIQFTRDSNTEITLETGKI